jgi:hypothetical protein
MIYFYILKYFLYNIYTKKGFLGSYYEGGAFGILLILPLTSVFLILDFWSKVLLYFIGFLGLIFYMYLDWDGGKLHDKYREIGMNKDKLKKEFTIVRYFIFFDVLLCILSALYRTGIRSGWFL